MQRSSTRKSYWWVLFILCCGLIASWLFIPKRDSEKATSEKNSPAKENTPNGVAEYLRAKRQSRATPLASSNPQGEFLYIYDKAPNANRFLIAKYEYQKVVPDSDAPFGNDLWLQDVSGEERQVHTAVYRARFSPDGTKIAYTTTESVLHVEDLSGQKLAEVPGAYEPNWTPDSQKVLFAQLPEGSDGHMAERARLSVLDLASHETRSLTKGDDDDSRPHVHPSGDWVLFTSGSRSGLASFWKVPLEGGEPVQLTNVGLDQVNEKFIPTPYKRTLWSQDRRWFLYDFKNGDREETWGLQFDADGTFKGAAKVGEGIDPQWQDDGRTFVYLKRAGDAQEVVVAPLPDNAQTQNP